MYECHVTETSAKQLDFNVHLELSPSCSAQMCKGRRTRRHGGTGELSISQLALCSSRGIKGGWMVATAERTLEGWVGGWIAYHQNSSHVIDKTGSIFMSIGYCFSGVC